MAELYHRRWEIKVRFRDIKTSMGMEVLEVKRPEMARRSLNRLQPATSAHGPYIWGLRVTAGKDSYCGAMVNAATLQPLFCGLLHRPRLRGAMLAGLYGAIGLSPIPERPLRSEPRALKRRPKGYKLLTAPRAVFREEPHRGQKRSLA